MLADVGFTGAALVTLAARHMHLGGNKIAFFHRRHVLAGGHHVAAKLMAGNQRRLDAVLRPLVPVVYVQIGAADGRHLHFHQNIVRAKSAERASAGRPLPARPPVSLRQAWFQAFNS